MANDPASAPPPELSRAVEALVEQWAGAISRAARPYGLDASERDEITQDVRLRFWSLLERDGSRAPTVNASYAMRAAMSAAVDLVRRHRQRRDVSHTQADVDVPGSASSEHELAARLEEALAALMPSRRVAVRLHLDGRSLAEIAGILRWSEAQARNQVYRGLGDLKENLMEAGT
jgi:RNA polymerase sigma factor (sigma-70 family)